MSPIWKWFYSSHLTWRAACLNQVQDIFWGSAESGNLDQWTRMRPCSRLGHPQWCKACWRLRIQNLKFCEHLRISTFYENMVVTKLGFRLSREALWMEKLSLKGLPWLTQVRLDECRVSTVQNLAILCYFTTIAANISQQPVVQEVQGWQQLVVSVDPDHPRLCPRGRASNPRTATGTERQSKLGDVGIKYSKWHEYDQHWWNTIESQIMINHDKSCTFNYFHISAHAQKTEFASKETVLV